MANYRMVNTNIWKDPWFTELRLTEQHLFLYLLTNAQTNIAGIYQVSMREMAFDTTIDQEEIKRIFRDRFEPDRKAFYDQGYVILRNWYRHQRLNPNQEYAAIKAINALPEWLRQALLDPSKPLYMPLEEYVNASLEIGNPLLILTHKGKERKGSSFPDGKEKSKGRGQSRPPGGGTQPAQKRKDHDPNSDEYWLDR